MKVRMVDGLPYVAANLSYRGNEIALENVLLDTGSSGVIFPTDQVLKIGLIYEPEDTVHRIRGVGGSEFVFTKRIDSLAVGDLQVQNFEIEVGSMDYGFEFDGIIGMDFLITVGAVIDFKNFRIYTPPASN
jgi:predicted aspartyl protease